ncbi:MAG: TRAP transporter large permease [Oscillospiraceae bacterium]|nr:TRAP transporter large permease [Oscillospiraceae bacterium]
MGSASMAALIIFGLFFVFIFLTIPIGISIGLSLTIYYVFYSTQTLSTIGPWLMSALDSFPLMAIPFFILAGSLMEGGGLSKRLIDFCDSLLGWLPGGLGIVCIAACAFFGAISGSAPATVAAIGAICLPSMVERGYDKLYATALIAASGCLGVIVPPSIPMVVYGTSTDTSVGQLFVAGFGPALAFALCLIALNEFVCIKHGYKGSAHGFSIKRVGTTFVKGIWALGCPVIILGGIYGGFFTPTEAAVVADVYGFIVGMFIYRELDIKRTYKAFITSSITNGNILLPCCTGTVLAKVISLAQIPTVVANGITSISDNGIIILLVINGVLLIVGMLMDTIAAIIVIAPILCPVAVACGWSPIHFGLIMVVNLAIGFITPPVGVNLFVASGMADVRFVDLSKKIIPFILVLLCALLITTYCEPLVMTLPNMMTKAAA